MLYLGIDIGKNTHVASLIDEKSKPLFKAFTFSNTTEGANSLIEKLLVHINNPSEVEIGMEATGHYWLSVYSFLVEKGFIIRVVNPIKTDFSDVFGEPSKEFLSHFQTTYDFENISSEQLENVLAKVSFKGFAKNKITHISKLAADSFGLKFCRDSFAFALQLRLLIEQIKFIDAQVCDVEAEIKCILDKINSPIMTIPGIGNINAAVILGEIGDISCFSNASKLAAYAGIDASVKQSGE